MQRGTQIHIELEATTPPFGVTGKFLKTEELGNESYVVIKGTVGENINKEIYVPQRTIKTIQVIANRREDEEWV